MKTAIKKDKNLILGTTGEVPPVRWLPKPATQDQISYWGHIKTTYTMVQASLTAYFSGQQFPAFRNINKEAREQVISLAQLYLKFYTLTQLSWEAIKNTNIVFEDDSQALKPYRRITKAINQAATPGELLARIIELDAQSWLDECKYYTSHNPRNIYSLINEWEKCQRLINSRRQLDKPEEYGISQLEINMKKSRSSPIFLASDICLGICEDYLKTLKKNDLNYALVRDAIKDLKRWILTLSGYIKTYYHPNKKRCSYEWNKGTLTFRQRRNSSN